MAAKRQHSKRRRKASPKLPTLDEIRAERERRHAAEVRGNLAAFVRAFWDRVEPEAPLAWTWHLQAICDHLQAVTEGRIKRLLINVPPGHGKSLLVCVFWPAWEWLLRPGTRRIFASHSLSLAIRDSVRTRALIDLPEYVDLIPVDPKTGKKQWTRAAGHDDLKQKFDNSATGFRECTSVAAKGTGIRGHGVVCDDPLSAQEIASEPALTEATDWWDGTMSSRLVDMRTGSRVIIMQRLHERDLSGHVLAKGGYEHLCLPSEYDPERHCSTSIGFSDPRTEPGELLNPAYFPPAVIAEAKRDLGARGYAGQHDQSPRPAGGNLVLDEWLHYYRALPAPPVGDWLLSWDTKATASKAKRASYVVGQCWWRPQALRGRLYLVDQVRFKAGIVQTIDAIKRMSAKWPAANTILVENKATGPAVVEMLGSQIHGIIPVDPHGDKTSRFEASLPLWEAGNVMLPDADIAPWVGDFVDEITAFPSALNDDQADAASQALDWFAAHKSVTIEYESVNQSAYGGRSGW